MNNIELVIKEKGLTKSAFADLMHTSRQNINSLIKNPTFSKIEEIATALDVKPSALFGEVDSRPSFENKTIIIDGVRYKLVPIDE